MDYRSLPRRYRPKRFSEVLGQHAVVTTLKNALIQKRLGHAYLFAGTRGTGKTTLARIFAKALLCNFVKDGEPCTECPSCVAMQEGFNLDFIEIDGASHRGIDDIRNINETSLYAASSGKHKIYLIDEVHMLTKEAFNALLKTLEEPPKNVLFFFATTEPQKVLPTILSRCQRFMLQRITREEIVSKLEAIAKKEGRAIERGALELIAARADGSLRDAESFLDQFLAFQNDILKEEDIEGFFGIIPKKELIKFDREAKNGNLAYVFSLTEKLFHEGKDFQEFLSSLISHMRALLTLKATGSLPRDFSCADDLAPAYNLSASLYSKDQLVSLLDMAVSAQEEILKTPSPRIFLETLLLKIARSHNKISMEELILRLCELEDRLQNENAPAQTNHQEPAPLPQNNLEEKVSHAFIPDATIIEPAPQPLPTLTKFSPETKAKVDTALHFAAVEFEGTLEKHKG